MDAPAISVTPAREQTARRKKALGAFYTPPAMAEKLIEWSVRSAEDTVLDSSFGGLIFLQAAHDRLVELGATSEEASGRLYGCELDEEAHAAALAHQLGLRAGSLLRQDFFQATPRDDLPLSSAVAGNPPYVRYQGFNGSGRAGHDLAAAAGVKLTRLASSWAPFVIHSTAFVAPGGRLALVLPAEMLHAQYAREVLTFVQRNFAQTAVAVFEERVFPGAMEEVVLLFAQGRSEGECAGARVFEYQDLDALDITGLQDELTNSPPPAARARGRGKLLTQLLAPAAQELYGELAASARVRTLGSLASVDIGAVTGANDFFLLRDDEHPELARELLRPTLSKAVHLRGAVFRASDFAGLRETGSRCMLFVADAKTPEELLGTASSYLQEGEGRGLTERYKCRVRKPWWGVPLPTGGAPDLFLTYCSSEHPRLVENEVSALSTNTLHGVTLKDVDAPAGALAAAFFNSLTLLSAELVGRSYGGGVLKLEPTEAEALLLPPIAAGIEELLPEVDERVRAGDLDGALNLTDPVLLGDGLGLNSEQQALLRSSGARLRGRRRARKKAPASR